MKRILFVLLTSIALFWLSGCGYTLVGQGSLPKHIKTIAIPVFENETLEEGIEEVITQAIIDVYVRGGKVRLVSETEADAILRGKIRSYNPDEALTYNDLDEVLSYKLTVTVDIEMQDLTNDEILWQQENLSEDTDFEAGPDFSLAERQDNEEEALEQLAEELAERILALSTEGF
jgi:outer membrane lipopolysaccharide assembly protein LptE/RlpB